MHRTVLPRIRPQKGSTAVVGGGSYAGFATNIKLRKNRYSEQVFASLYMRGFRFASRNCHSCDRCLYA
jgi:hypothetical protein